MILIGELREEKFVHYVVIPLAEIHPIESSGRFKDNSYKSTVNCPASNQSLWFDARKFSQVKSCAAGYVWLAKKMV